MQDNPNPLKMIGTRDAVESCTIAYHEAFYCRDRRDYDVTNRFTSSGTTASKSVHTLGRIHAIHLVKFHLFHYCIL